MRFLLVVSLAAAAIVLASRSKKMREEKEAEELDYEDDILTDEYDSEGNAIEPLYSDKDLQYSEPSAFTSSAEIGGETEKFNRPEYESDNEPIMEVDAETDKRESLMSNSNKIM